MKKIVDYRKFLGVTEKAELQELKTVYRNLVKTWHPDKFHDNPDGKAEAEEKSKYLIEAYHFLVSIAPETRQQTLADYMVTTAGSTIVDYEFKSQVLKITFLDGNIYEYFDVPKAIYVKLVNSDSPARFARRHIYTSYVYRSTSKLTAVTA
ncbi:MAG: KTSC domain-containing protein [Taibaiella sp.]|nr:KTSC domain-containing protein [Taibaiella sp.]